MSPSILNAHYAGLTIEEVRERLKHEIDELRVEIAALMQAAVQAGSEVLADSALPTRRDVMSTIWIMRS